MARIRSKRASHKWYMAGAALLAIMALVGGLRLQAAPDTGQPQQGSNLAGHGNTNRSTADLIDPKENSRQEVTPGRSDDTGTDALRPLADDLDEGWGEVRGRAMVNGRELQAGSIQWSHPMTQEQGRSTIEDGVLKFFVPVGLVHVSAWITADQGLNVEGVLMNSDSVLRKFSRVEVLTGKPSQLNLIWDYPESVLEGDVLGIPSGNPFPNVTLLLTSFEPNYVAKVQTDAAGNFHCTAPKSSNAIAYYTSDGVQVGQALNLDGWTQIRIPDSHAAVVSVINSGTGDTVGDFDLFIRAHVEKGNQNRWYRPKTLDESDPMGRLVLLPRGRIDLMAHAPRRGLAPTILDNVLIQPNPAPIRFSLDRGGTLVFTCSDPPPTGLRNPGYDPDPIMVVEQRMFDWEDTSIQTFGAHVDRDAAIPRNFLFNRRLAFSLQGEAVVKGLPAGIYRVLHWRAGLNWRSEALEVVAGVTTRVQLISE